MVLLVSSIHSLSSLSLNAGVSSQDTANLDTSFLLYGIMYQLVEVPEVSYNVLCFPLVGIYRNFLLMMGLL